MSSGIRVGSSLAVDLLISELILDPVVIKHGHSLVIPPHFDGNNYAYWKVRMKAFLNQLMRESGTLLNTDERSPLPLLVSGKLLNKKQPCSIAKL